MSHEQMKVIGRLRRVEAPDADKPYAKLWVLVEKYKKKTREVLKHWYSVFLPTKMLVSKNLCDLKEGVIVLVEGTPTWAVVPETVPAQVDRMIVASYWPEVIPAGPEHGCVGFERLTFVGKMGNSELCEGAKPYGRLSVVVPKVAKQGGPAWYTVFMFESLLKGHGISRYVSGRTVYVEGTPDPVPYKTGAGDVRLDVQVIAGSWPELIG